MVSENIALEEGSPEENPLAPYLTDEFILFIHNKKLLEHIQTIMQKHLKFSNVTVAQIGKTKKEMVQKLATIIMTKDAQVLLQPSMLVKNADMEGKIDLWNNFLINVSTRVEQAKGDKEKTLKCMSKITTILEEAENYMMREKFVRLFGSFRIPGVFIFPITSSSKMSAQIEERLPILEDYLIDHLTNKGSAIERIKEKENEVELSKRKADADKLMEEGRRHKENRNFKEAVDCFEKAIRIFPSDPEAYIESGRGFTKLKKYNRAVQRFSEAEEIARELPAPSMEIGNVKLIQVKDMIDKGADPDSDEVAALLVEASDSFKTALDKADELQPLHQDDKTDRGAEAVSTIARAISEHGLAEKLGSENKAVKELSGLIGDSLKKKGIDKSEDISTPDRITLGLVAADRGEYEEAEELLFRAVEDKKYLPDACWGINYLGAQVRQSGHVEKAFGIYYKLLMFDPPNKAAIHFNLAVAWMNKDDEMEASGEIVQSVYTDPGLVHDDMFKKNEKLIELLDKLIKLFSKIKENAKTIKPPKEPEPPPPQQESVDMHSPEPNPEYSQFKENFEGVIKSDRPRAMKALYDFTMKKPDFFASAEVYGSSFIMDIVRETYGKMESMDNPKIKEFVAFLSEVMEREKQLALPSTPRFAQLRTKFEEIIRTNRKGADRKLYDFMKLAPGFFASVEVYRSETIMSLICEAYEKYGKSDNETLKKFVAFLSGVMERQKQFLPPVPPGEIDYHKKLDEYLSSNNSKKAAEIMLEKRGEREFFDNPKLYESQNAPAFISKVYKKYETSKEPDKAELVKNLGDYLDTRENYMAFRKLAGKAIEIYMETMDQRQMVNYITKAIVSFPGIIEKPYFYADQEIINASNEIHKKITGAGVGEAYKA